MNRRHELHLLTGAYAADALSGAELAGFEKHMERCAACAEEVRGLREAAAQLGLATAIAPPPGLRERVLAAAASTRQLPPSGRKPLAVGALRPDGRPLRRLSRPVTVAAAVAMAVVIAVLAFLQTATQHQLDQAQAQNKAVAAVLNAPDASIRTSVATVGGTVTAVISLRDHEAVITTSGMPIPAGARVYQLWVISTAGARSAGLLPAAGTGPTSPVLAVGVRAGDKIGITVEPAGGSARPTTIPVILLAA